MIRLVTTALARFFNKSFFQNLVVVILGLTLGIPFGIWTNKSVTSLSQRPNRATLIKAFIDILERNANHVKDISANLFSDTILNQSIGTLIS